jgi:hypothetical protein
MKRSILFFGILLWMSSCGILMAQNKTLGVGATSPNPNAVLHVESPTGNQGFIMPRLTTTQRLAAGFISILGSADNGLMVYDTTLKTIFIWDGASWKSSAQVAGGPKLVYPYVDTIGSAPDNSNLLRLIYAGSATENVGVAHFENLNPNSGFSTIFGRTNSKTNGVADFIVNNPLNNNDALGVSTNGTGSAIFASQTGTGVGIKSIINNVNNANPAIWAQTNSNQPLSAPIFGLNTGTGDVAASFKINNGANTFPAVYAESNGTGRTAVFNKLGTTGGQPAVFVSSQGGHGIWADHNGATGYAAIIQNINATNPNAALFVEAVGGGESIWAQKSTPTSTGTAIFGEHLGSAGSAGVFSVKNNSNTATALAASTSGTGMALTGVSSSTTSGMGVGVMGESNSNVFGIGVFGKHNGTSGFAGSFESMNPANTGYALKGFTLGTGAGVYGENAGTGNGFAGLFNVSNAANTYPAIQASSAGSGSGVRVIQSVGTGAGMDVFMQNTSTTANGLNIEQQGLGNAGFFRINNVSNNITAVFGETNGTGNAVAGLSTNTGRAAYFQINNSASTSPAVTVTSNGTGSSHSLEAFHTGTGDAVFAQANSGSAGNFQNTNVANTASAIFGMTNAPTGYAMGLINSGNGNAVAIFQGGVKVSTNVVTAATIATRAAAYRITSGGTAFTFGFTPEDGDVYMVFNDTGSAITVQGVAIPLNEGRTIVNFAGIFRGF